MRLCLKSSGVDWSNAVGFTDADMNNECEFQEFWMLLLKEELVFVELPRETGVKTFSGYPHKEDKLPPAAETLLSGALRFPACPTRGFASWYPGALSLLSSTKRKRGFAFFQVGKPLERANLPSFFPLYFPARTFRNGSIRPTNTQNSAKNAARPISIGSGVSVPGAWIRAAFLSEAFRILNPIPLSLLC